MSTGWNESAQAWLAAMGTEGDWGRKYVLDPAMLRRIKIGEHRTALDVGCGEGRFCRLMRERGIETVGIDPTSPLLEEARSRDPTGHYIIGTAESLPFESEKFDLVVSYLTLIDVEKFRIAIGEMARVLKPNGRLLIANITSFFSAGVARGWVKDENGGRLYYPVDQYLEEFPQWLTWAGIRVKNWHRPLGAYMNSLLEQKLLLLHFQEPEPTGGDLDRIASYRRAPWFLVMEWVKRA